MIKLKKIHLPNGISQWCLLRGEAHNLLRINSANLEPYVVKTCSSDLFVDHDNLIILKAPPVKSFFKTNLVKLCGWTPADKEARGSGLLNKFGFKTSQILGIAIPINPFNSYRSLLFLHYIQDAVNLKEFLLDNPDAPGRLELLDKVAMQTNKMIRKGVSFRDFYFGNLLYKNDELIWIDTEVQYYCWRRSKPMESFLNKKDSMRARFLRTGGKDEEWERFFRIILGE